MKLYRFDENSLMYSRFNLKPYVLFLAVAILILTLSEKTPVIHPERQIMTLEVYSEDKEFSLPLFKQFVIDCGIKFPDIVIAQAIQESGFKSDIWKENNNPFGLKVAKSRNTTAIGVNRGHALYKDWEKSVIDYAYMQAVYARKVKTREQYFEYLKNYAEDENYCNKLKRILRKHKSFGISDDYLYY